MAEPAQPESQPRAPRGAIWLAAICALAALSAALAGTRRVAEIERAELELQTEPCSLRQARALPSATRLSARIAEIQLARDQHAVFELCAQGALGAARFRDAFELLIIRAETGQLMLRVPLDAEHQRHVRASATDSCLLLGSGLIEHTGSYRIEAVWPKQAPPGSILDVALWAHIQASPALARGDLWIVLALGAAVLLGLACALIGLPRQRRRPGTAAAPRLGLRAEWLAPAIALAAVYLAMQWPTHAGPSTLVKGGLLLGLQLSLPVLLLSRRPSDERSTLLGLTRLPRPAVSVALSIACVPVLVTAARAALRIVPSTEVAPIQTFIAWPGGMLSAALLGVLLPVGEELLFRGYLLGVWLSHGRGLAATASVLSFGLLHLQQSWGNWGGLLSIFLTGAVLCGLRLVTGSTILPAASHVAYNLTLSASSLMAALNAQLDR